ncbi:MAG: hypothetical protein U0136_09430 [Bdellovibrionota bacterium]
MSQAKFGQTLFGIALAGMLASAALAGCLAGGGGDTDGGQGNDDAGIGAQPVSDGGFGASLTIALDDGGNELRVAERKDFFVTALDPNGLPLTDRRVFCESEKGIAILEPSSGGVAFEHTGSHGTMSGVLGGVTPGSYLLECRLEEGFNLVARKHLKVIGEVPAGFQGFPGAAGGNLGGGVIVENPNDVGNSVLTVEFLTVTGQQTANGPIDTARELDCDNNVATNDPETYGDDNFVLKIDNPENEDLVIDSVTFTVDDGRDVESSRQKAGLVVAAGSATTLSGTFTEPVFLPSGAQTDVKAFAGTSFRVLNGTFNVNFRVRAHLAASGESVSLSTGQSVTFQDVNNCGG